MDDEAADDGGLELEEVLRITDTALETNPREACTTHDEAVVDRNSGKTIKHGRDLESIPEETSRSFVHPSPSSTGVSPVASNINPNSSTDSDVLIQSTSAKSNHNDGTGNHLKAGLNSLNRKNKTVRIASSRVREIRSPFEDISDGNSSAVVDEQVAPPLVKESWEEFKRRELRQQEYDKSRRLLENGIASTTFHPISKNVQDGRKDTGMVQATSSSGRNVLVATIEKHESGEGVREKLVYKTSPTKGSKSGSDPDSSASDIVTVVDTITTVHAQTSLLDSSSNESTELHAVQPNKSSLIKQGLPDNAQHVSKSDESDVTVSRFSSRRLAAKENLARRSQSNVPTKRVVKPNFVTREAIPAQQTTTETAEKVQSATTSLATAAVVAATQPLMKIQTKLELQLESILSKIAHLEQTSKLPVVNPTSQPDRVSELEQRLSELTNRRLQHIEQLQQQQLEWQAKMLYAAQQKPQLHVRASHPGTHDVGSPHSVALNDISNIQGNSRDQPYQRPLTDLHTHSYESERVQASRQDIKSDLMQKKDSPLDTPAPRRVPPLPTSKDNTKKGQSLFEAILAADETPYRPRSPHNILSPNRSRPALHSAVHFETPKQRVEPLQYISLASREAPLNNYLMDHHKEVSPVSIQPSQGPLSQAYTDIMEVLERARSTREILDRNIDTVLYKSEPFSLKSLDSDRTSYIKKLVDASIGAVSADIKTSLQPDGRSPIHVQFMEPERDTNNKPAKLTSKRNPKKPGEPAANVKDTKTSARTKHVPREPKNKPKATAVAEPSKRSVVKETDKSWKPVPAYMDDSYIQRVYGRPRPSSPSRSKLPPKISSPKKAIPERTFVAAAVTVQSSSTQTQRRRPPGVQSRHQQTMPFSHQPGKAVPLGAPRIGGQAFGYVETTVPKGGDTRMSPHDDSDTTDSSEGSSTSHSGDSSSVKHVQMPSKPPKAHGSDGSLTSEEPLQSSTPKAQTEGGRSGNEAARLTRTNVKFEVVHATSKIDKLSIQCLPSVNIESDSLVKEEVGPVETSQHSLPSDSDDNGSLKGEGVALPGSHRGPAPHYHGPAFPPQPLPSEPTYPSSSQLAEVILRRDLLENRAAQWIEQEIMARMLTSINESQLKDDDNKPRDNKKTEDESMDSDQSTLLEAVGQRGVQVFVDAGQPVDTGLVNSLVKEVLQEQIISMLGSRAEPRAESPIPIGNQDRPLSPPMMTFPQRRYSVPTPEVTPRQSPEVTQWTPPVNTIPTPEPSATESSSSSSDSVLSEPATAGDPSVIEPSFISAPAEPEPQDIQAMIPPPPLQQFDVRTPEVTPPTTPVNQQAETPALSEKSEASPLVASPEPWGNPDSPLSEEGREAGTAVTETPLEVYQTSIHIPGTGIQDEQPDELVIPPPLHSDPCRPVSTGGADVDHSTITVTSVSSPSSSVSDTDNQSVSRGQWLPSRSMGEMKVPLDSHVEQTSSSLSDTLHGSDELSPDDSEEHNTISEGQVVPSAVENPVVSILAKMKSTSKLPGDRVKGQLITPVQGTEQKSVELSPGEVVPRQPGRPSVDHNTDTDRPMSLAELEDTNKGPPARVIHVGASQDLDESEEEPVRDEGGSANVIRVQSRGDTRSGSRFDAYDPRVLTPDQMNMQALLQSGYLSQSFSTEGGATTDLMATDKSGPPGLTRTLGSTGGSGRLGYTAGSGVRGQFKSFDASLQSTGKRSDAQLGGDTFGNTDSIHVSESIDEPGGLTQTLEGASGLTETLDKSQSGQENQDSQPAIKGARPLTVSVKMPSLQGAELSDTETDDISEYSLGN